MSIEINMRCSLINAKRVFLTDEHRRRNARRFSSSINLQSKRIELEKLSRWNSDQNIVYSCSRNHECDVNYSNEKRMSLLSETRMSSSISNSAIDEMTTLTLRDYDERHFFNLIESELHSHRLNEALSDVDKNMDISIEFYESKFARDNYLSLDATSTPSSSPSPASSTSKYEFGGYESYLASSVKRESNDLNCVKLIRNLSHSKLKNALSCPSLNNPRVIVSDYDDHCDFDYDGDCRSDMDDKLSTDGHLSLSNSNSDDQSDQSVTGKESANSLSLALRKWLTCETSYNRRRHSHGSIYSSSSSITTFSQCDTDDEVFWSSDDIAMNSKPKSKPSAWRKVRNIVHWSPFVQTYKKQKYPWIQLAGHQGNFKSGGQGIIMKKASGEEETCFNQLMNDPLKEFVPFYKGKTVSKEDDEIYLELEDLLANFHLPRVMDLKMGVRTYLEDELAKAREKPKLRKDMYEKMVQIDPNEPTDEENRFKAVTKPRYMIWRETISSTANLGFRVEGIKCEDGTTSKDFKTIKYEDQVEAAFLKFIGSCHNVIEKYLKRLIHLREVLSSSSFFKNHELIGSSLLFVHDDNDANVWMIDFAKTFCLPDKVNITHENPWEVDNHEDGYLIGVNSLIKIFTQMASKSTNCNNLSNCSIQNSINEKIKD